MTEVHCRRGGRDDVPAVAVVLARAFQDDPVYIHALPDPEQRAQALPHLMRALVTRLHGGMGHLDVAEAGGHLVGVAAWDAPGQVSPGPWRLARALPSMLRAAGRGIARLVEMADALEHVRPDEPHHYLFHLGTDPGWWGRGVGTALLAPTLADADRRGEPCHLECKPGNVGYYERFGFTVAAEIDFGPVELFAMTRSPRG